MEEKKNPRSSGAAFKAGAVALAFMIIGYQTALFVHLVHLHHLWYYAGSCADLA